MHKRSSGVLLHISSLPSAHGLGDFGPQAHAFIDFLASSGQSVWQILPLSPTNPGAGNSPYSSYSAFAGNPLFISPDLLVRQGILQPHDLERAPDFPEDRVDYERAMRWKTSILDQAFDNALVTLRKNKLFINFCQQESPWLDDYALFMALKQEYNNTPWYAWPLPLRLRTPQALHNAQEQLGYAILREKYFQYLFATHWHILTDYAHTHQILLFGDTPIYVSLDSSDVWANQYLFELDDQGLPIFCAGAPPDYFSATGQMWGNPVYDWEHHKQDGFSWWIQRLSHEAKRFDIVRLDHFRGFCGFWQVPACEPTAENGVWIKGPGTALFSAISTALPDLRIVAEDLGMITDDVVALMQQFTYPGMKVLHFAFSEDMPTNAYIPHNITANSVVYTGTHDNNTTRGWFLDELDQGGRSRLEEYAGQSVGAENVAQILVRLALSSAANLCIIPMQDYLGLDGTERMNTPGISSGNWSWRVQQKQLTVELGRKIQRLSEIYGRWP